MALVVVGHGLRARAIEGPLAPSGGPVVLDVMTRRYRCRACDAILVVVPARRLPTKQKRSPLNGSSCQLFTIANRPSCPRRTSIAPTRGTRAPREEPRA